MINIGNNFIIKHRINQFLNNIVCVFNFIVIGHPFDHINVVVHGIQGICSQLCEKLSSMEEMDRIDQLQLFQQSVMVTSPLTCCLQGAADTLLGDLISQDRESSKLIFQLLLDGDIINHN